MNNTGLVGGNVQNNVPDRPDNRRSTFNLTYNLYHTARFGEISCHFAKEGERGDTIPMRSEHDLRTYTMKAPLMQDIGFNKAYFVVSREALLPNNWEKIYTNPVQGDDINAQEYGTSVEGFYYKMWQILNKLWTFAQDTSNTDIQRINCYLRFIQIGSMIYSRGSLMWQLGYKVSLVLQQKTYYDFDQAYDAIIDAISAGISSVIPKKISILYGGNTGIVVNNGDNRLKERGFNCISLRMFLDMVSHEADTYFNEVDADDTSAINNALQIIDGDFSGFTWKRAYHDGKPIDLDRPLAYQLCCAHYISNDHVDYIYSAELYRQNMFSLIDKMRGWSMPTTWYEELTFIYNGVRTNADYLSAAVFNKAFDRYMLLNVNEVLDTKCLPYYQYLLNIFQFQNSLRYRDYFTGSRTYPLAVGNVNVAVDTGTMSVNVLDVTRNIQMQRFLNSVNRTGRKWANYLEGLIGGKKVGYDYHNPMYLGDTKDIAYAVEVENTGADQLTKQNSVTSIVKSNAARFAFEVELDRPSIVIGVEYFDIARNYIHNLDRALFHVDRFDMFNPQMEFIGDQEVDGAEISLDNPVNTFGYQGRYEEYKQNVNSMVGGFVDRLPGYAFSASEETFANHYNNGEVRLSPYYIRSHPYELDEFYTLLTGWNPAYYYHFIIASKNDLEKVTRAMAKNPQIL